jgi:hypothetical protein
MSTPGTDADRAAEELRLLALGLLDRAEPGLRTLLAGLRERVEQPAATEHSAACTWCPLCATVGLLRGERPVLAETIAQHANGLVAALRVLLTPPATGPAARSADPAARSADPATRRGSSATYRGDPATGPADPDPPPTPPPVQHIEVRQAGEAAASEAASPTREAAGEAGASPARGAGGGEADTSLAREAGAGC